MAVPAATAPADIIAVIAPMTLKFDYHFFVITIPFFVST
jgi:hypothetical protein